MTLCNVHCHKFFKSGNVTGTLRAGEILVNLENTLEKCTDLIGIVRKIIFRCHSVPFTDGFMNIFIQRAMKDISIQSSS